MNFKYSSYNKQKKFQKFPPNLKQLEDRVCYRLRLIKNEGNDSFFTNNIINKTNESKKDSNIIRNNLSTIHKESINSKLTNSQIKNYENNEHHEHHHESHEVHKSERKSLNSSNSDITNYQKNSISTKESKFKEFENSLKKHANAELEEQRKIRRKVIKIMKDYTQCKRFFIKTENFNDKILNQYVTLLNEISNQKNHHELCSTGKINVIPKNRKIMISDLSTILSDRPPIDFVLTQSLNSNELSLLKMDAKFYKKNNKNLFDKNDKFFTNSSLIAKLESEELEENIKEKTYTQKKNTLHKSSSLKSLSPLKQIHNIEKEINNVINKKVLETRQAKINTSEIVYSNFNSSKIFNNNSSVLKLSVNNGKNLLNEQLKEYMLLENKVRNMKVSSIQKEMKLKNILDNKEEYDAIHKNFIIKENFIEQNKNFENYKKLLRRERKRQSITELV
jgi:hypothetical protein